MSPQRQLSAIACFMAFVLCVVPTVDVFAFGVHEHTAAVDREGDTDNPTQPSHAGHMLSHHCDLSMTPLEISPRFELTVPLAVLAGVIETASAHARYTPFVTFSPPRS